MLCIFISDLHGNKDHYRILFKIVEKEKPDAIFIGGDLLSRSIGDNEDVQIFLKKYFMEKIIKLKKTGIESLFFVILGNDDPRIYEQILFDAERKKIIEYIHDRTTTFGNLFITGYSYIPPTPFRLKDWEKYDVSRYTDVGAISPEEGIRTIKIQTDEIRYSTIMDDLNKLSNNSPVEKTIYLFHSPPYDSKLDRAELDGKFVDHTPIDIHIGSIAIQRFIKERQPFLTLHGHVHESARLTGCWKEKIVKTHSFNAAHDGPELAVIRFDTNDLKNATRELIKID